MFSRWLFNLYIDEFVHKMNVLKGACERAGTTACEWLQV